MKNSQKGFSLPLLIIIIAALAIGAGTYIYSNNSKIQSEATVEQNDSSLPPLRDFENETSLDNLTATTAVAVSKPTSVETPAKLLPQQNISTKPIVSIIKPVSGLTFKVGDIVDFESSLSFQPKDPPIYDWDFGNGEYHGRALGDAGKNYGYVYYKEGEYTVALSGPFANTATVKVKVSNDAPHVAIQKLLTLSLDPSSPQGEVNNGQSSVEIMKLRATATTGNSDVANFYIRDFSTTPLQNVKIYEGGRFISNATDDGGHLHSDFGSNSIVIGEGESKIFTIKADISASATGNVLMQISGIENKTPKLFVDGVGTRSNTLVVR